MVKKIARSVPAKKQISHPSHSDQIVRLNRIKGQIEGISKMIADRRYCPDILVQVKASISALKALQSAILETHLHHCVKSAIAAKDSAEAQQKVEELVDLFHKHL